jgi:hypothetical protein
MNIIRSRIYYWFIVALLFTVTVAILTFDRVRFALYESLAQKFGSNQVVFVGDSMLARGEIWAFRLDDYQFKIRNLAVDGYTIRQVHNVVKDKVVVLKPCSVIVMAGINRHLNDNAEIAFNEYKKIINLLMANDIMPVILETLYKQGNSENNYVTQLNQYLRVYSNKMGFETYNTNAMLAENMAIELAYTDDGLHLNEQGYIILQQYLKGILTSNSNQLRPECSSLLGSN